MIHLTCVDCVTIADAVLNVVDLLVVEVIAAVLALVKILHRS